MGPIGRLRHSVWLPAILAALASGAAVAATPAPQRAVAQSVAPARSGASDRAASEVKSIRITYHDLDLTTPEGVAALYLRVHRAAIEICDANRPLTGTRLVQPATEACVRATVSAAVKR